MASGTLLHLRLFYPSISLSSNQRMVFSSIKSFSSGNRLDFSVSSSTPSVPLQRAASISAFSCSSPAISCSSCSNSFFSLKDIFRLVIQAHAGGLFLFWLFRLFLALLFRLAPVTIIGVVTRKITNVSLSLEYQQVIYHLVHEITVVAYYDYTALEVLQIFFQYLKGDDIEIVGSSSSTRKLGLRISTVHRYRRRRSPPLSLYT